MFTTLSFAILIAFNGRLRLSSATEHHIYLADGPDTQLNITEQDLYDAAHWDLTANDLTPIFYVEDLYTTDYYDYDYKEQIIEEMKTIIKELANQTDTPQKNPNLDEVFETQISSLTSDASFEDTSSSTWKSSILGTLSSLGIGSLTGNGRGGHGSGSAGSSRGVDSSGSATGTSGVKRPKSESPVLTPTIQKTSSREGVLRDAHNQGQPIQSPVKQQLDILMKHLYLPFDQDQGGDPPPSSYLWRLLDRALRRTKVEFGLTAIKPVQDVVWEYSLTASTKLLLRHTNGTVGNLQSLRRVGSSFVWRDNQLKNVSLDYQKVTFGFNFTLQPVLAGYGPDEAPLEMKHIFNDFKPDLPVRWGFTQIGLLIGSIYWNATEQAIKYRDVSMTFERLYTSTAGPLWADSLYHSIASSAMSLDFLLPTDSESKSNQSIQTSVSQDQERPLLDLITEPFKRTLQDGYKKVEELINPKPKPEVVDGSQVAKSSRDKEVTTLLADQEHDAENEDDAEDEDVGEEGEEGQDQVKEDGGVQLTEKDQLDLAGGYYRAPQLSDEAVISLFKDSPKQSRI